MVAEGKLPAELKILLENPRIRKVGRLITSDLASLQDICKLQTPFTGSLDLAWMAKERCLLRNIRTTSLADLAARVLHRRINKNVSERLSTAWTNTTLTPDQLKYASLDAYASLKIYEVLKSIPLPRYLADIEGVTLPPGTSVMLYSIDRKSFIGSGELIGRADTTTSQSQTMFSVKVTSIFHRGARLPHDRSTTLGDCGEVPFVLSRYPQSHIAVYYPHPLPSDDHG